MQVVHAFEAKNVRRTTRVSNLGRSTAIRGPIIDVPTMYSARIYTIATSRGRGWTSSRGTYIPISSRNVGSVYRLAWLVFPISSGHRSPRFWYCASIHFAHNNCTRPHPAWIGHHSRRSATRSSRGTVERYQGQKRSFCDPFEYRYDDLR